MTKQAGERLLYKGEETSIAAEPLNQYLQNRNDTIYSTNYGLLARILWTMGNKGQ